MTAHTATAYRPTNSHLTGSITTSTSTSAPSVTPVAKPGGVVKRKVGRPALGWKAIIHRTAARAKLATAQAQQASATSKVLEAGGWTKGTDLAASGTANLGSQSLPWGGQAWGGLQLATCSAQMPFAAPIKTMQRGFCGKRPASKAKPAAKASTPKVVPAAARAAPTFGSHDGLLAEQLELDECAHALLQMRHARPSRGRSLS